MAVEPVTLFSATANIQSATAALRNLAYKIDLDGPDSDWRRATLVTGKLWNKRKLIFTYDKNYLDKTQLSGMQGYFMRFPEGPHKARALKLIPSFKFALGTLFDPECEPNDPRLTVLCNVAEEINAVLFLPSGLRDFNLQVLFDASGQSHPDAKWPENGT